MVFDVYLEVGYASATDAVGDSLPGIGEAARVHDEAIHPILDRPINAVDARALVVGLKEREVVSVALSVVAHHGVQLRRGGGTVLLRLPLAQPVHVCPLNDQDLECPHSISSSPLARALRRRS
jgi:hypothetical protein